VRAAPVTVGRQVRVEQPTGAFEGRAVSIGDDGRLCVENDQGIVELAVGDVIHARLLS